MRNLRAVFAIDQSISPNPTEIDYHDASVYSSSGSDCHGFLHNAAMVLPSALFVLYLGFLAKKNIQKLTHDRAYIMIAYYLLLWFSSLLNLVWCSLQSNYPINQLDFLSARALVSNRVLLPGTGSFEDLGSSHSANWKDFFPGAWCFQKTAAAQAWQCTPGKDVAWNLLSLLTASGMLCLEISLVAFLLQENCATGLQTLPRTFLVSGLIVGVDMLLKSIFVFGFGVPLFIAGETRNQWKWGLWTILKLLLTGVYGFILFVHYSKWRDKLPLRPTFYKYILVMFVINAIASFASGLAGSGTGFGFWLYDFMDMCYHSLYLPFLYVTFLADLFQAEDLLLDNAYYSEMKDAGFFDADWD
ncbi:hypothetical protein LguiA_028301 [Lonicera macranthoides]